MNIGKAQYDAIPIPKELDRVIGEAISQTEREVRAQTRRRWLVSAAAVLCAVFLNANITPDYAYASHLLIPNRLILTLYGVRTIDYGVIEQSLLSTEAVQSHVWVYPCFKQRLDL